MELAVKPYSTTVSVAATLSTVAATTAPSTVVDEYSTETRCSVDSIKNENNAWIVVGKSPNKRKAERVKGS